MADTEIEDAQAKVADDQSVLADDQEALAGQYEEAAAETRADSDTSSATGGSKKGLVDEILETIGL